MTVNILKGTVLRPSARIQLQYGKALRDLIVAMQRETKVELVALFRSPDTFVYDHADSLYTRTARELGLLPEPALGVETVAMDASISELAARLLERIGAKFSVMFDNASTAISSTMTKETLVSSDRAVTASLKEVSKSVTLKMTPYVEQMVDAGAAESTALIRSVPDKYLSQIAGDVMRSITSGNGLQDLIPALNDRNEKTLNWAANVAKDQTRKVFNNINKARMQGAGVKKAEWIHSGGSNKPRKYHIDRAPGGLNGLIFNLDDPPIIDENTGERGIPGQLPYCGCTMRPIIDLSEED